MSFIIDVREACRPQKTGKGQWTMGFVTELHASGADMILFTDGELPPALRHIRTVIISGRGIVWHLRARREALRLHRRHRRIYVSPTSYIVPALLGARMPCIPIIHDLIAFRGSTWLTTGHERHEWRARHIERMTLGRAVRNAAHICTISDATKKVLLRRYIDLSPKRVTTIGAGPRNATVEPNTPDGKTIVCIGTLCPRKNQERLIRAFAHLPDALRRAHSLVIAGGRGWNDSEIVRLSQSTAGVVWKDYIADADYEALLGHCTVVAVPSLYEGFGLTVLDALQHGVPVLTSDRGSLQEVAGDAAVYVDPESVPSIARGLEHLLRDAALRERLRSAGPLRAQEFSWTKTAKTFTALAGRL